LAVFNYGPKSTKTLDDYVDDAIERMKNQPEPVRAAANLLIRWGESDSEVQKLFPDLVSRFIEQRVKTRAKRK